jgi:hypothetical protein
MLEEIFAYIESPQFAAMVNVANDVRTFTRALDLDETQRRLYRLALLDENSERILERIGSLLAQRSDITYENPGDVPLATYLRVLYYTKAELAFSSAQAVADAPRLWWAEYLARSILRTQRPIAISANVGSATLPPNHGEVLDYRLASTNIASQNVTTEPTVTLPIPAIDLSQ